MNLVKGVADLLRRSAGGQYGEGPPWGRGDRLSAPSPKIHFGEVGEEAVLNNLWQRYENTIDKVEKRKLLQVFLMHFIQTYKDWKPVNDCQLPASSVSANSGNSRGPEDIVIGCSSGHPSEMILILIQEIARITSLVTEFNYSGSLSNVDLTEPSSSFGSNSETLHILKSLTIITRSIHNCKIFSYYGGVQKITALMKATVIQLKSLSAGLAVDDNLLKNDVMKVEMLGNMLLYVVSIIFLFMDSDPDLYDKVEYILSLKCSSDDLLFRISLHISKEPISEARLQWQQRAVIMLMEAGGLNWLVELLRVIRRLNLKDQWSQLPLQHLAIGTIKSALHQNPRAQNHFRSIGGIEALLDQLGLSSSGYLVSSTLLHGSFRAECNLFGSFQLQVICLEALRESIYGNITNLQFLCENGRVQKFATSICSPAFILHELQQHWQTSSDIDSYKDVASSTLGTSQASSDSAVLENLQYSDSDWIEYCTRLSTALCSFLVSSEDFKTRDAQAPTSQNFVPVSFAYSELSVKWFMKVLVAVFPCIKACSSEKELPSHLRTLATSLQHHTLSTFRMFLLLSPKLLEVFREEGLWDCIFSKDFFYFRVGLEESHVNSDNDEEASQNSFLINSSKHSKDQAWNNEIDILQMEAISFAEFAATLAGNAHIMPECSILLKTLEKSACNPEISNVIVKSLHRILQLAVEQSTAAFNAVNAVSRVLKVACVQACEHRKQSMLTLDKEREFAIEVNPCISHDSVSSSSCQIFNECLDSSLELFTESMRADDNARSLILHNNSCIDCLFDLFWEKRLRGRLLDHILALMKLPSSDDRAALLYVCSKYLETLASAKESEDFVELSIDLLVGMRDILQIDRGFYQDLFREGECFLHVVSLLNGMADKKIGEQLVLNVLQTLTFLLSGNDISKSSFRALVGQGYQTLQSLLLDFCHPGPSLGILSSLLDMLVDGKFETREISLIKNGDVIMLFLVVLQKCSEPLRGYGLDVFMELLKDSITNRDLCFRAGMLSFLLDWFCLEQNDDIIAKLVQLIQIIGGHSMSGKDIRKIFAILRSERIGSSQKYCSLLLTTILTMLKEKGPAAFFEFSGHDSGILIETPIQWPCNKGFTFSCWIRVEGFPATGVMGLFNFQTDNGRGCSAMLGKEKLVFESVNQKWQSVSLSLSLLQRKWHFLCITHSIGRAFAGGSTLRCFVDGDLVSAEKCRYSKITEVLTCCAIGAEMPTFDDQGSPKLDDTFPFYGQIGPVYLFSDSLSSEQIKGLFSLGPSYMYSFVGNETQISSDILNSNALLDGKDGLSSKIIFGLSAQAADGQKLFNVSSIPERMSDKNLFRATVMSETRLCSRRILQEIIYCVGGVSVFFPLLTRLDSSETFDKEYDYMLMRPITSDKLAAEVVQLIASVLDQNPANQQQMHLLSGFSILGFLFQSLPPQQLNMDIIFSLNHLLEIVRGCDFLVKEAVARIYLNPHIWVYVSYEVQRELYMFLIQHFENDANQLTSLCGLPRIIDIIRQFYWDKAEPSLAFGAKPLLHPTTGQAIAERPSAIETHKIRLLLLSLSEMSLKEKVDSSAVKALIAFFEKSQDMVCIEDVLQMVMRVVSQSSLLLSFLEQVNLLGGCHIFINLLQRDSEPIRLLGLQFLGKLLVGPPSEKKSQKFFNLSVGRPKSLLESYRKVELAKLQPLFAAMSDRLFKFPLSDHLCATLFDVLLGGASPKQVLQKYTPLEKGYGRKSTSGSSSHFAIPQILVLIFKFFSSCNIRLTREKILNDLLNLLDSNPSNIQALMEYGWHSWLATSVELAAAKSLLTDSEIQNTISKGNEQFLVRNLYCIVLSHYIYSVKGGWQKLEDAVDFLLANSLQDLLQNIFRDLVKCLVEISSEENKFLSQPCRDNTFYLLKLIDEKLANVIDEKFLFPMCIIYSDFPSDLQPSVHDIKSYVNAILQDEGTSQTESRTLWSLKTNMQEYNLMDEEQWKFYDNVWTIVCELNGKGPSKASTKASSMAGPSFGQRARGLVESLNIPAAEMAAVVVSGGIGSALGGKTTKCVDKAMILRGEKCPRIIFRLLVLYLCEASLERASSCIRHFGSLLPSLFSLDEEQYKNRLQLYIWSALAMRSQSGIPDGDARFDIISHLIVEMVNHGKTIQATLPLDKDDSFDSSQILIDASLFNSLIQKDGVISAAAEEVKYLKALWTDRLRQTQELRIKMDENLISNLEKKQMLEDEIKSTVGAIISSDDSRRAVCHTASEEDQQIVAEKWVHLFRTLVDERAPWAATAFPNSSVVHWKHDKMEDNWRRRPKLRRNYHFEEKLCYPSAASNCKEINISIEDKSLSMKSLPEQMKRFLLKGVRGITSDEFAEHDGEIDQVADQTAGHSGSPQSKFPSFDEDHKNQADIVQDKSLPPRVTEPEASKVLLSIPCVLVTPKRKIAGHLAVRQTILHFSGLFLVEGTGGSAVFKGFKIPGDIESSGSVSRVKGLNFQKGSLDLDMDSEKGIGADDVDHGRLLQKKNKKIKRHRRWNISKIKSVHWTRYLLQYTAIEIFFNDYVPPVLLNFASPKDAKTVGTLIVSSRNEALLPKGGSKDKTGIISFVDRRVATEMTEAARESWRRREISNFEYLMTLNTLSGRSYNDITQYPVFPWILADYTSEQLDFNKSSTFRDLSKPVGALDPKRFEVFEDRYHNFSDPDIPSFYYGSHYSSMGIVLYYLLRLEPFTGLHRNLQGGKFDHADRLFQSVEGTYKNCMSNTSDVKELIPEFFYMPEFLVNSNSYHLGVRQDGEPLGDVTLPSWAKGSPEEFIWRHREALESEYVSSNLHHWIDLVFGYKQRGKPAVEAANVFYYLTYEGAVDLESLDDDLQRSAIEDQIANFGQTPIQIFRKKHPRRGIPIPIAHPLHFAPASITLTSVVSNTALPNSSIVFLGLLDCNIVVVNENLSLTVKMWLTTQLQSGGNFTFSSSQDPFFGIGTDLFLPRKIGVPVADNIDLGKQCFATLQRAGESFIISCGSWDSSFQVISLQDGRTVRSIRQHKDVVSCVAVTSDGSIIATGSYDTTVMLWDVSRIMGVERRVQNMQNELLSRERVTLENPIHILCGHDDIITCLSVSLELDVVISGSKDGTCIFHTLREGRYVRSIQHPSCCPLTKLVASQHGRIVIYAENDLSLHMFSINGKHLAFSDCNGRLNCMELSCCGEFLVCGGDNGQIVLRSMHSLEVVKRYEGIGKTITSLAVTPEECFLAGTRDGSIVLHSVENPQLRKASLSRNMKVKGPAAG